MKGGGERALESGVRARVRHDPAWCRLVFISLTTPPPTHAPTHPPANTKNLGTITPTLAMVLRRVR